MAPHPKPFQRSIPFAAPPADAQRRPSQLFTIQAHEVRNREAGALILANSERYGVLRAPEGRKD
jgi:hypothetical protein